MPMPILLDLAGLGEWCWSVHCLILVEIGLACCNQENSSSASVEYKFKVWDTFDFYFPALPYRFKDARPIVTDACRWQHSQAACQHTGFVWQNISKEIGCHYGIKVLRISQELHCSIVNVPAASSLVWACDKIIAKAASVCMYLKKR